MVVQWLEPRALFTAVGLGSFPRHGTNILQAVWHGQKQKTKQHTDRNQNILRRKTCEAG